ncbi:MAG TPA: hypothetical protein V6D22_26495 [Candidatus Obscuribacterales bacterium]
MLEVAEDHAVLRGSLVSQTQIKDDKASGNITLRTESVISLINSHWDLQNSNPDKTVHSALLTTGAFGTEQQLPFPNKMAGLEYWRVASRDASDLKPLRDALLAINIKDEIKTFIGSASDEDLRNRLIRPISWIAQSSDLAIVKQSVKDALVRLGEKHGILAQDAEKAEFQLLGAVIEAILLKPDRQVNRADLMRAFGEATSMSMPMQTVQQMAMAGALLGTSSALLPGTSTIASVDRVNLPPRIADRKTLVSELSAAAAQTGLLWLHGSSGLGKTTLALQIANKNRAEEWLLVDLRDCKPEDVRVRLFFAARQMSERTVRGVILDDFPGEQSANTIFKLAQFIFESRLNNSTVVITSHYEPSPELTAQFGSSNIDVQSVPYLDEEDVADLVKAQGGNADIWSKAIHVFCGMGHPQLVNACILSLSSRGWAESEMFTEVIVPGGGKETRKQQDVTLRRLITELPDHIRALLYRLSLVMSGFDRNLAMSIANAQPAVQHPRDAFNYLLGPWIENRGEDRFAVSPLVSNSAQENLSPTEQSAVRKSVIYDLIQREPFPAEHLSQLLLNAYIDQDATGLIVFYQIMITNATDRATFAMLAREVSSFPSFIARGTDLLFPKDKSVSAMLRIVQCLVAVSISSENLPNIFERMVAECRQLDDAELAPVLTFMGITMTLMYRDTKLNPHLWMDALKGFDNLLDQLRQQGLDPNKLFQTEGLKLDQLLFGIQATSTRTVEDLHQLFEILDGMTDNLRDSLLKGVDHLDGTRLMVDNAWLNESKSSTLQGEPAAKLYADMVVLAAKWHRIDIAVFCLCAQVVMLDEYAGESGQAKTLLEAALKQYPKNYHLLRRLQTLLYRKGDFAECLSVYQRIQSDTDAGDQVDRLYSILDAARSAVELNDLQQARSLFYEGSLAAEKSAGPFVPFAASLLADCAVSEFLAGNKKAALEFLLKALKQSDSVNPDAGLQAKYCLSMIPHAIAWMRQEIAASPRTKFEMKAGLCSNPSPDEYFNERPIPPKHVVWYQLAELEREAGAEAGIAVELRSRLNGSEYTYLEGTLSRAVIGAASAAHNVDAAIAELPRFLHLSSILNRQPREESLEIILNTKASVIPVAPNQWDSAEYFDGFRFVMLAFSICAYCDNREDAMIEFLEKLRQQAVPDSKSLAFINLLLDKSSTIQHGDLFNQVASSLAACRTNRGNLPPDTAALLTVYVALWLNQSGFDDFIAKPIVQFTSDLWTTITKEKRAVLNTPSLSVPAIEAVCSKPSLLPTKLAELSLAIDRVTSFYLPIETRAKLEAFIQRDQSNSAAATPSESHSAS